MKKIQCLMTLLAKLRVTNARYRVVVYSNNRLAVELYIDAEWVEVVRLKSMTEVTPEQLDNLIYEVKDNI